MEAQLGKASEPQTQALNANLANRADKLLPPFKQENRIVTRYLTKILLPIEFHTIKIELFHEKTYI